MIVIGIEKETERGRGIGIDTIDVIETEKGKEIGIIGQKEVQTGAENITGIENDV